jgi:hypothetical protein
MAVPDDCAADDELIACLVSTREPGAAGVRLATLQVDHRQASVSESTIHGRAIEAVVDGRILLSRHHGPPWVSVDRFANTIDTDLPGRYLTGSDDYAIFQPEPDGPYTVQGSPANCPSPTRRHRPEPGQRSPG